MSAKAQHLMTRYALDRALVEASEVGPEPVNARRIWLDAPYVGAKSLLVNAVASVNRCRTVLSESLGFVTVMGEAADLVTVEVLTTSLLVQASRGMLETGRRTSYTGQSRTRSYRQSFLIAYATRIRERLQTSSDEAIAQAELRLRESANGTSERVSLLPVLAAREARADALVDELFGRLVTRPLSVSNPEGYYAGRAAADLAVLDSHQSLSA